MGRIDCIRRALPITNAQARKPGGIPGFGIEAVLMGVLLSVLLIWYSRR